MQEENEKRLRFFRRALRLIRPPQVVFACAKGLAKGTKQKAVMLFAHHFPHVAMLPDAVLFVTVFGGEGYKLHPQTLADCLRNARKIFQ